MKHSVKKINALVFLMLLCVPTFAIEQITDGNTPNLAREIESETGGILSGINNPTATSIGRVFNPLTSSMTAFFTKLNEKIDYFLLLIDMMVIVSLLIGSQILLIRIWKGIISLIIKSIMLYRLLKTPQSRLADLIELLSNGKATVSEDLRKHLKNNSNSNKFMTKASLFLSYIL